MEFTTNYDINEKVCFMYGNRPAWGTINQIIVSGNDAYVGAIAVKYAIQVANIEADSVLLYDYEIAESIEQLKEKVFSAKNIIGDESN